MAKKKPEPLTKLTQLILDGFYLIDKAGFVYTKKSITTRKIKRYLSSNGYLKVNITHNKKNVNLLVHRLLALTFIPNPENKPEVNHKDGDKQNNNISNLEWATTLENMQHARRTGLTKGFPHSEEAKKKMSTTHKALGSGGFNARPVLDLDTGMVFPNAKMVAAMNKFNYPHFSEQLNQRVTNTTNFVYANG